MNSCILMATIVKKPELRHTSDTQTAVADFLVEFEGTKAEERWTLRAIGWGNLGEDIYENYNDGDRVIIVGRLSMKSFDNPKGFKEKKAELVVSSIQRVDGATSSPKAAPKDDLQSTYEEKRPAASKARQSKAPAIASSEDDSYSDYSEVKTTRTSRQTVPAAAEGDLDDIPF
jgi:single-strand DNA-binding protein